MIRQILSNIFSFNNQKRTIFASITAIEQNKISFSPGFSYTNNLLNRITICPIIFGIPKALQKRDNEANFDFLLAGELLLGNPG